jgi:hypothetical protein
MMWIDGTPEQIQQIAQEAHHDGFEWYRAPEEDKIKYLVGQIAAYKKRLKRLELRATIQKTMSDSL